MDPQAKLELDRLSGNSNLEKQACSKGMAFCPVDLGW